MPQKTHSKEKSSRYSTKDVYKEDYESRDKGGAKKVGYLDTAKFENVKFYSIKEGRNELDIIPYVITTENHPQERAKGKADYKLDIWVHRFVGENEENVLCLAKTFKDSRPCPICQEIKRMIASQEYSWKDDEIKKLNAKHREVYNVIDLTSDDKEIQLFDMNHFEFQKEIIEEAEAGGDGEFVTFAELDDGKSIVFRGTERDGNDFKGSFKPKSFKFIDRDPYDDDIVEEAYPLDAMLVIPTYEQVKNALFGVSDAEEEKPSRDRKQKAAVAEELEEEEEPKQRPRRGKTEPEKKSKKDCPNGGEFGKDCDELDECKDCKMWNECSDAFSGDK